MDFRKYNNIVYEKRTHCMICGLKQDAPVIVLPQFPLTELYVREKCLQKSGFLDQALHFCSRCHHGQIANVIDIGLQYGDSSMYNFRTSQSITGRITTDFFINFFNHVVGNKDLRTIVEIGCNDLFLLKGIKTRAKKLVGIDPILKGREQELSEDNIIAIGDFLENVSLPEEMDVVICKDVLEHVADPFEFLKKIVDRSDNGTLFFVQVPLLETILQECRFDQVFHQHLNYFSFKSFFYMLEKLNCSFVDVAINYDHWSTGLFAFRKGGEHQQTQGNFKELTVADVQASFRSFKNDLKQTNERLAYFSNEKVYGYGAGLMLAVLSYYMENDFSCFSAILDDDKDKDGMSYLNLPVNIQHIDKIKDLKDSVVMLTAVASKINVRKMLSKLMQVGPRHIIYPLKTF